MHLICRLLNLKKSKTQHEKKCQYHKKSWEESWCKWWVNIVFKYYFVLIKTNIDYYEYIILLYDLLINFLILYMLFSLKNCITFYNSEVIRCLTVFVSLCLHSDGERLQI